jgi:hypothetical protein
MAGETEKLIFPVDVDLGPFERNLSDGLVEGAIKGGARLQKSLADSFDKAEVIVRGSFQDMNKAANRWVDHTEAKVKGLGKSLDTWGKSAKDVGKLPIPGFQTFGNLIDDVSEGVLALTTPTGLAIGAVVGLGAAAVGGAAGVLALGAGVTALVMKTDDLIKSLEPFEGLNGFVVSDADVERVGRANAAVESIGVVASRLAVTLGTELAPYVERVATVLVAMGLAGVDAFNTAAQGTDLFRMALANMVELSLSPATKALEGYLDMIAMVGDWVGVDLPEGFDRLRAQTEAYHKTLSAPVLRDADAAWGSLEMSLGDYMTRAEDLITVQDNVNDKITKGPQEARIHWVDLTKELSDMDAVIRKADEDLSALFAESQENTGNTAVDAVIDKYDTQIAKVRELVALGADRAMGEALISTYVDDMNTELEATYAAQEKLIAQTSRWDVAMKGINSTAGVIGRTFNAVADGASALLEVQIDQIDTTTKKGKEQAAQLWKYTQGLAVAQTIAAGAVAAVQAFAQLGPVAGAIAAGGIAAGVVAQSLATIKSTAPEFDIGTGAATAGGQSDQFLATLSEGEGVLTRKGVEVMGGPRAVESANAGVAPAGGQGPMEVVINFRDRTIDRMVSRVARGGGELADMVLSDRASGVAVVYR